MKDSATGCLLVSVSLTLPALTGRQLLMFSADQRARKTGFYLERTVFSQFLKAQRRSAVPLGFESVARQHIRRLLKAFARDNEGSAEVNRRKEGSGNGAKWETEELNY